MGVAAAGHHVLALGVGQKIDPQHRLAGTRVAREADTGTGAAAGVAEHHALDGDGSAHGFVNAVEATVFACLVGLPGGKHGLHCLQQLGVHVLRERVAGMLLVEQQKALRQFAQLAEVQLALVTALGDALQFVFEQRCRQARHHFAIAGDQAAVGVPDQARIAGLAQQAGQGGIAQADVQQGFHHARHGNRCAGADRHDQRLARIAQLLPGGLFQRRQAGLAQRCLVLLAVVGKVGAHDQRCRYRQAGLRHAQQVPGLGAHAVTAGIVGQAVLLRAGGIDQVEMLWPECGTGVQGGVHAWTPVFSNAIWRRA